MRRRLALLAFLTVLPMAAPGARAQSVGADGLPIAWGESERRHTTVCAKRWHAVRIRDVRTDAVHRGLGADKQIELESRAVLTGEADCVTGDVIYAPVTPPDVILGAETWVQIPEPDGPVPCFDGRRCRWGIQMQSFVEAEVTIDGQKHEGTAYVATPRVVQPARLGRPPAVQD